MKNDENINVVVLGWIESLVISVIFVVISALLQDPLSLKSPFPWIWFAPVLVGLRYGIWPSLFSIGFLLITYLYGEPQKIYSIAFQLFVLGGFVLTLICVGFSNYWMKLIRYSDQLSMYLQNRIQNISHAYKVVLFSYQRLEHCLISKPVTVRSSLNELRLLLAEEHRKFDKDIYFRLLNIIAFNTGVEVAGIYKVTDNKVQPTPITALGKVKPLKKHDFLIEECLEKEALTHISSKELLKGSWSEYLVAAPLFDQTRKIYAVLIIEEMPFLKLNTENLAIINLFLYYFSDGLGVKDANQLVKKFHGCPMSFANELLRLMRLYANIKKDSAMVAFHIKKGPHQEQYLYSLRQEVRGIDSIWETKIDGNKILLVLMPLSTLVAVQGYRARIEEILGKEFGIKLNDKQIKFKTCLISAFKDPQDLLTDILDGK